MTVHHLILGKVDPKNIPDVSPEAVCLKGCQPYCREVQEAQNTLYCPSLHEKFYTVISQGVRNISETLRAPCKTRLCFALLKGGEHAAGLLQE